MMPCPARVGRPRHAPGGGSSADGNLFWSNALGPQDRWNFLSVSRL